MANDFDKLEKLEGQQEIQYRESNTTQDKVESVDAEAESILEAIEVGSNLSDTEPPSNKPEDSPTNTTTAQDWSGPHDPGNPMNWSLWKRAYHTAATAFLAFSVTVGSSLITPATPEIQQHFQVSRTVAILSLSLFVLGLGLGPVVAAPISESWGRSVVYKTSTPLFLLFILGAGFSRSIGSLLVCRLLAGVAGGPCITVGTGTNADLYPPHLRAISSTLFAMMPFLGPSLGPVIGGFVSEFKGWRWTQWCTIFVGLAAALFALPMSETYKKVILKRRAKALNVAPPPGPTVTGTAYMKLLLTVTLIRPVHMLLQEPIVLLFSLYNAFNFSVLFAFFAAYPYVFKGVYGFTTWQYGLTFLAIGMGVLLAVGTAIAIDRTYYMGHYRRAKAEGRSVVAPEYRLLSAQIGSFGIPIGLFWFAWTARSDIHWLVPTLAGILFAWGNLSVFLSASLYLVDTYGALNGASAMAANGLMRYTLGAVFPLFTVQMYTTLGIGWATSLLGFLSVALLPIPFVFFKYGPKIRAKSHYDTLKVV